MDDVVMFSDDDEESSPSTQPQSEPSQTTDTAVESAASKTAPAPAEKPASAPAKPAAPQKPAKAADKEPAKKRRMGAAGAVCAVLGTVALAFVLLAVGFLACAVPNLPTKALSTAFSTPLAQTGFSKESLADVAVATRDYSFGAHDRQALDRALFDANKQAADNYSDEAGRRAGGYPNLDNVDEGDADAVARALSAANDRYAYSDDVISHLDDCYTIATRAYLAIIVAAIVALVCFIVCGVRGGKRHVARMFKTAGIVVVALIVACFVWGIVDFSSLFETMHQTLFAQTGNWTFDADSLLICALPQGFWVGMGVIWLATTIIASILSIVIGSLLSRRRAK